MALVNSQTTRNNDPLANGDGSQQNVRHFEAFARPGPLLFVQGGGREFIRNM